MIVMVMGRGQGPDWTIDGADAEVIYFEWEYEVIPLHHEVPPGIFLKQAEMQVMPSLSWINLSDQLVKKWKLPKGTLLRIFPAIGTVDNQDDEDHSYTIEWKADKQYRYDIIYDHSKDLDTRSKEIVMVDSSDRTDTFVVPVNANVHQVRDLWKGYLEIPHDIEMHVRTANEHEFYWNLETAKDVVTFTFRS
jgi:hypothetical protein